MSEKRTGLKREYVRVDTGGEWRSRSIRDGLSYGGNQSWFTEERDGCIKPLGCGLISCADILLYKTGRTRLTLDEYKDFVRSLNKGFLRVRPKLGVNGIFLAWGLKRRFRKLGLPYKAKWCFSAGKQLERIRDMLERDMPVTLSAGPQLGRKTKRGGVTFLARNAQNSFALPAWRSGLVRDHYVTVTGLIEEEERKLLEISSWGERYYIDWEDYRRYTKPRQVLTRDASRACLLLSKRVNIPREDSFSFGFTDL